MPASSDIYGQIRQPEAPNRLAQLAQMAQLQGVQDQSALAQYGLKTAQRNDEDNALLRAALSEPGADPSAVLLKQGRVKEAGEYLKNKNEARKVDSEIGKNDVETEHKTIGIYRDASQALTDPQSAAAFLQTMHTDPRLKNSAIARVPLDQVIAQIPQDPAQFGAWKQQFALGAQKFMEMNKPTVHMQDAGGVSNVVSVPGMGGPATVLSTTAKTQTPDSIASNATSRANNRDTIAAENMRAGVSADGTPVDGGGLLSPESVINAATRYNMDGTLPPNLGRGTQGPRQTAQILNEAARQAAARGDTPEAQRIAQVANKASAQALGTIEKQATMVGAFEKNFNKNADLALELSQKVDRTGAPILNKWINAGRRSVTGDADLAAFDANLKATVNEYAKIVGGGTGSGATAQGEIAKVESLLSAAQTPQQLASVITTMKRETANRMTAFEEQKTELRNSMIRPGSAKPATPAPGATSAPAGIDPAAIAAELKRRGVK